MRVQVKTRFALFLSEKILRRMRNTVAGGWINEPFIRMHIMDKIQTTCIDRIQLQPFKKFSDCTLPTVILKLIFLLLLSILQDDNVTSHFSSHFRFFPTIEKENGDKDNVAKINL